MKIFKTLIVDDETLARDTVRGLLQADPEIHVVGEAADGRPAIELIRQLKPDILILDICMPILSGVEALLQLKPAERPATVFVTAYDEYAVRAFELHAIDYVVKPFTDDRFKHAVAKAKTRANPGCLGEVEAALDQALRLLQKRPRPQTAASGESTDAPHFILRQDREVHLLEQSDIRWIKADGDFIHVHTKNRRYFTRMTLVQALAQLNRRHFIRIHKSVILNVACIRCFRASRPWGRPVELDDGTVLRVSRNYRQEIEPHLQTQLVVTAC